MKTAGFIVAFIGVALIGFAACALPYVFYIGLRYSWIDYRIDWAPLGMVACFGGVLLVRIGHGLAGTDSKVSPDSKDEGKGGN